MMMKNLVIHTQNVSFPYRRILKLKTDGRICPNWPFQDFLAQFWSIWLYCKYIEFSSKEYISTIMIQIDRKVTWKGDQADPYKSKEDWHFYNIQQKLCTVWKKNFRDFFFEAVALESKVFKGSSLNEREPKVSLIIHTDCVSGPRKNIAK